MLDGLRIMSKNIFGRLLLASFAGLIVIGLGFWGIRDMFSNFRGNQVAVVGDAEISIRDYRMEYQNELQRVQRQARRAVTNDEARQAGLDRQVLARLMTGAAIDQQTEKLGLAISDAEVAKLIRADRTFFGPNGEFDQTRLNALLRDNGYTESGFVREQRESVLRQELAQAVSGGLKAPKVLLEAIGKYNAEARAADYFTLSPADPATAAMPADDALKAFFELRRDNYRSPEYRKVIVLIASPAEIAKSLPIADEVVKKAYESTIDRFSTPEKRAVSQLTFASREAADKAKARIDAGESFEAVAADKDAPAVQADLGVTTKAAMFDPAVGEAAFGLAQPGVAAPIKGAFGFVLARVTSVEPGSAQPFDSVKDQIKSELALAQAKSEAQKLHDKIEDLRSSGKPLAQAAEAVGFKTEAFVTDAAGGAKAENGKAAPIPALVAAPELLKAIFASDIGVDNDSVSRKDGGFDWFEITGIEASRLPSFDEAKAAVTRALQENNAQRELAAKANDLARQLDAGADFASLAAANGVAPQKATSVRRSGGAGLTQAAVAQIFGVPVGGAGVALGDKGARIVFRVTDSQTPPLDMNDPQLATVLPKLEATLADDLIGEYISGLQGELGVRINQTALRAAQGGDQ